jgi:hypothetical protein
MIISFNQANQKFATTTTTTTMTKTTTTTTNLSSRGFEFAAKIVIRTCLLYHTHSLANVDETSTGVHFLARHTKTFHMLLNKMDRE